MKEGFLFILLLSLFLIIGCQNNEEETMVLLDEKIKVINVSESNGVGDLNNEAFIHTFDDKKSIKIIENAIRSSVKKNTNIGKSPDFDVLVEYEKSLPTHAIYLWLGEENEPSTLMYFVGEGETYVTTGKVTNQLRELLISE